MQRINGNIWTWYDQGAWVGITTNGIIKDSGALVMGAGIALQAAQRFPGLDKRLGALVHNSQRPPV